MSHRSVEEENYQVLLSVLEGSAEVLPRVVADMALLPPADRPEIMGATREHDYRTYIHLSDVKGYLDDIIHYGSHLITLLEEINKRRSQMAESKQPTIKQLEARVAVLEETIERMKTWAKSVNEKLAGKPAAASGNGNTSDRKWPEAIDDLSIAPVPADYDGLFATFGWDRDADEPMIWVPNDLLDSPAYTEQDGGDDYLIIPVISKANKASWMGVLADGFAEADSPERRTIENRLEGSVNEGLLCSPVSFGFLRSVRGKQTDIDVEAWTERRLQTESVEAEAYETASEDPF